ncbi:single-stranded DNA-binding protein [uncultured Stenotrophomonas sp.]|uniref:single-stranded DNA-binding protein n=1 Tax=uncultured Stenotrophomonas sp. TaxID=165438 RepID=UPI0025FFA5A0|nr:single-stranded DNA-binding protein [uncultured Stenotrophomonas sp.]
MANDTTITVVGNLTADPELRFTPNGAAVANFTIASTPRHFDRQANEWKDGETLFVRGSVWREQAENAAESLSKGMAVIAQGHLKAKSFQDKEGNNRTSWELDAHDIGPSLRRATAQVKRNEKNSGAPSAPSAPAQPAADPWGQQNPAADPWGGQPSNSSDWGTPNNGQPAF